MKVKRKSASLALATILLLTLGFRQHIANIKSKPTADVQLEQLPLQLGDWKGTESAGLDVRSQEILQLNRYVKRSYTNSKGQSVFLYVGYWRRQTGEYQAAKHSPALCLPSNGWRIQYSGTAEIEAGPNVQGLTAKKILGETKGQNYLFYYWFFTGESSYSDEWQALLRISIENFLVGRSDGGIIEISTALNPSVSSKDAEAEAERVIEDFAAAFTPELAKLITPEP